MDSMFVSEQNLCAINSSSPGQNGRHIADMFKHIFLNENIWISNKISLKYVGTGSDNRLAPSRRQATIWTNADRFTNA